MLQLLQYWVRLAVCICVRRQQQNRNAVNRCSSCCGNHVQRSRTNGSSAGINCTAAHLFCICYTYMCDLLLVLALHIRQIILILLQRLSEAYNITMTENAHHTLYKTGFCSINIDILIAQELYQRLRHSQTNGLSHNLFLFSVFILF